MNSRLTSLYLTTTFLTLLLIPLLFHLRFGLHPSDLHRWHSLLTTEPLPQSLHDIDADFDRRFLLRFVATSLTASVPQVQSRLNNVEIQTGTGDWRFAAEDTQVCTSAGFLHPSFPRPQQAANSLINFNHHLQQLHIHLLVIPVPAKATIYPDRLDPHYNPSTGPFLNVDNDAWFSLLQSAGVDALDLTPLFWSHRNDSDQPPLFYPADTHWTDRAKQLAADAIAHHLSPLLTNFPPATPYQTRLITRTIEVNLLDSDNPRPPPPPYREQVLQLEYSDPATPLSHAQIVLLGDSLPGLQNDSGAGFAQRLTQSLHTDIRPATLIGAGPDHFLPALFDNRPLLPQTRIAILVFSLRHLLIKDWPPSP